LGTRYGGKEPCVHTGHRARAPKAKAANYAATVRRTEGFEAIHRAGGGAAGAPGPLPVPSGGGSGSGIKATVVGFGGETVEVAVGATVAAEWVQSGGKTRFYKCSVQSMDMDTDPPTASLRYEVDGGVDPHVPLTRLVPWCQPGDVVRAKVQRRFRLAKFVRLEGSTAVITFCPDREQDGGEGGDSESSGDEKEEEEEEVEVPEVDLQPVVRKTPVVITGGEGEDVASEGLARVTGVSSKGRVTGAYALGGAGGGGSGEQPAGRPAKKPRAQKQRAIKASLPARVVPAEGEDGEGGEGEGSGLGGGGSGGAGAGSGALAGAGTGASGGPSTGVGGAPDVTTADVTVLEDVVSTDGVFGDGFTTGREPTSLSQHGAKPFGLSPGPWDHRSLFQLVCVMLAGFKAYGVDSTSMVENRGYARGAVLNPKFPHINGWVDSLELPGATKTHVTYYLDKAVRGIEEDLEKILPVPVAPVAPGEFVLLRVGCGL
jgi:hypothetical protein